MTAPTVFGVVGGGWRAKFYFRIAQALPEQFQIAGCVARTEATRARISRAWNIRVFDEIDALLDQQVNFVVTSVPWAASPPLLVELTSRDVPEASQDHYLSLMVAEAARTGKKLESSGQVWG
jgi:hypothetical protein